MTEPTPDANWPSVWTVSAARMSSFSAYREAGRVDSSEMRVKGVFVASSEMRACGAPT